MPNSAFKYLSTIWVLGAAALTTLLSIQAASAETAWEKTIRTGTLSFANASNYPPMEFMQDGKNVGFDVEMGEEIARRLGVKAEWTIVEYKGIIGALKASRADVILSAMSVTDDRAKEVTFTRPYTDFGIAALYAKNAPVLTPADAKDKVVGVEVGTAGERWARQNLTNAKEIKAYEQLILGVKDLSFGRIDLVLNNQPALAYTMGLIGTGGKPLQVSELWDASTVAALAVRHGEGQLLVKLNQAIASMEKDGFLEKLKTKWFSAN
jgi:ABC-type amino acid transport substrate-binding protein